MEVVNEVQAWLDQYTPEQLGLQFVFTLGLPTFALVALVVATWLKGWIDAIRTAYAAAKKAGRLTLAVAALRPVQGVLTVAVTVLIPVAQALLIVFFFFVGNYISFAIHEERVEQVVDFVTEAGWATLQPDNLKQILVADPITLGYPALGVLVILLSYRWAARRNEGPIDASSYVIGLPGVVLMGGAALSLVVMAFLYVMIIGIALLGWLFTGENPVDDFWESFAWVLAPIGAGLLGLLYWGVCRTALAGSQRLVDSWRPRRRSQTGTGAAATT